MPRTKKTTEEKAKKKSEASEKKIEKKAKLTVAEFEKEVIKLAEQGLTAEKIGEALRKQGNHSKEHGIKISKILKEKNLYVIPDIKNIEKKYEALEKHAQKNKQDKRAKREKDRLFAKLRRARKHYKIQ
jgi:ribosomal protein S15P/S13E